MALFRRKSVKPPGPVAEAPLPSTARLPPWVTDGDRVRPLLRVQIVPPGQVPAGCAPLSKTVLPGELTALVEVAGAMAVQPEHLRWWGMEPEDMWAVAMHNMRAQEPDMQRGPVCGVLTGDRHTAAQLVRLHEFVDLPEDGALVWIPLPVQLIFFPLATGALFVESLQKLALMRAELEGIMGGPEALARHGLYGDLVWCRGRTLEVVRVSYVHHASGKADFRLTGSPRFSTLWNRLLREQADSRREP
ncbi:hypothetical protein [Streptomyces sp. SID5643]|uniref:hypothetical protein n=1 Tax=Streptomyces sp. SID5643 TaxID=2690307 RepID=UPI0013713C96|nr:hypothetical protein [Streptomyces sp. SID5643]MZF87423.1 hypothetical protein [Streptomyces sp. SID5643]